MPTITIKNCSQTPVTNATIGNGSCYNVNQSTGEYVFGNCDSVKACAGQSKASVTVNDSTEIPASGGSRTFSVYYYGLSSATNATKSGSWSGNVSMAASTCPKTETVGLTASANTDQSSKTYTLTFSGTSASVTQAGAPAPATHTVQTPPYVQAEGSISTNVYDIWVEISDTNTTYANYYYNCGTVHGGQFIDRNGQESFESDGSCKITINVTQGNSTTVDCQNSPDGGNVYLNTDEGHYSNGLAGGYAEFNLSVTQDITIVSIILDLP